MTADKPHLKSNIRPTSTKEQTLNTRFLPFFEKKKPVSLSDVVILFSFSTEPWRESVASQDSLFLGQPSQFGPSSHSACTKQGLGFSGLTKAFNCSGSLLSTQHMIQLTTSRPIIFPGAISQCWAASFNVHVPCPLFGRALPHLVIVFIHEIHVLPLRKVHRHQHRNTL